MEIDDLDFLPLRVVSVGMNGKRTFDPEGKRRLIEICMRPGVSVARMALKAGVNANQLRNWIDLHVMRTSGGSMAIAEEQRAFVPVVEVQMGAEAARLPDPTSQCSESSRPSRMMAQLPNGARLEFECSAGDAHLISAVIEALGRSHVPARR